MGIEIFYNLRGMCLMELRVLRYFLAVAEHGNFSSAAEQLHLTQPTLSRQIMELEEEMGTPLFVRGRRQSTLTEAGRYMRKRSSEILELAERTKSALQESRSDIAGDVYIAGGETKAMSLLARAIKNTRAVHPGIKFHLFSGNAEAVAERLDKGLADFGVFIRPANLEKYEYINFPMQDNWGLLIRKDDPLAERAHIEPEDLAGLDLICSRQEMVANELSAWTGKSMEQLNVIATYTLLYNASLMVREGIGAAVCLDGIADTSKSSPLCFRPFKPSLKVSLDVAWKKQQVFSKAADVFLQVLKELMAN